MAANVLITIIHTLTTKKLFCSDFKLLNEYFIYVTPDGSTSLAMFAYATSSYLVA
jgi:hypothetical protein